MAQPKQPPRKTVPPKSSTMFDRLSGRKQDIACILILYALVLLLFGKIVFNNMAFSDSPDATSHEAFLKAIETIKEKEDVEPLWLPYIFSGMPAFAGLLFPRDVNFVEKIAFYTGRVLFFNSDLSWFPMHYFMMGLFMYLLARQMKFAPLPSLLAAVTLMLNPFAIGLAQSGHGSKLITLSYVPLLLLLTHNLFKKRDVLSFGLLAVVTGTLFLSRHPQIAFYGLLITGCYLLWDITPDFKTQSKLVLKKAILFVLALAIGFAIYSYEFLPTDQYAKYSIRGGSETGVSKGLDYDYATSWSFHPFETITYVIPSFFGFSSQYVAEYQGQEGAMPLYWGWMPFTDCPVYIGIIPLMLGIIALIYNRDRLAWFLGIFSLLILMLSFGKYFSVIYDLFFNYFPYFNKFRVPVLILYLMPMTFGLLAANGCTFLTGLFSRYKESDVLKLKKRFMILGGLIAASVIIGFVGHDSIKSALSGSMFVKSEDHLQFSPQVIEIWKTLRFDVLWNYYVGFAVMVVAFVGLIVAYFNRRIAPSTMVMGFIAVLTIDLYLMDTKFITPVPHAPPHQEAQFDPTIQAIKAESDTSVFRVLPVGNVDGGNMMMYNHIQSVEGYSPAKLKIYQDMRDSCFARNNINVFNMLNVKYIVGQQKAQDGSVQTVARLNPTMLPRAWFVDTTVVTSSKAETFAYLNSPAWNPRTTAILEHGLPANISRSEGASVAMTSYRSRAIVLKTVSSAAALLVVSEVYYPAGWEAYIDGNKTEIYKTNYILRSVVVPAGTHTVEFKFDPPMYQLGYTLSRVGWGIALLVILLGVFQHPSVRRRLGFGKKTDAPSPDAAAVAPS